MQITDLNSAELIKYASNTFLAMKISFINAISRVCELCGADVGDVAKGMGSDSRIGPQFLNAGLGWGGSCFPKDVQGLLITAQKCGYDFGLVREVIDINDVQTPHFLDRIEERLGGLNGKTIGILGLAFKPNTDDIRDARSLLVIDHFLKKGAKVQAYDPVAMEPVSTIHPEVQYTQNAYEVADSADVIVLITEWNEFKQLDMDRLAACMKQPILFDGRRVYSRAIVERAGFEYYTIGA
jgi:UDPglucose 6-dehydrogenase